MVESVESVESVGSVMWEGVWTMWGVSSHVCPKWH